MTRSTAGFRKIRRSLPFWPARMGTAMENGRTSGRLLVRVLQFSPTGGEPEGPADQAESVGWRARVTPSDHPVAQFQFNALIGADGKRNTLQVSLSRVPLQGDTSPGKPRLKKRE